MPPSWRAAASDSPRPSLWGAFQKRWGFSSSRRNPSNISAPRRSPWRPRLRPGPSIRCTRASSSHWTTWASRRTARAFARSRDRSTSMRPGPPPRRSTRRSRSPSWPLARTDRHHHASGHTGPMKKNIPLLYGFPFFDQFMIVIAVWVPYLAMKGIGMRQFMELQAVFALVILCGELPSGVLSDLWGRKKTLLLGSTLKAVSFSLLPLWSSYEGFLFYHLTMGIALSMISGGDVALLY